MYPKERIPKPDCPEGTAWGSEAFHEAIERSTAKQKQFYAWYKQNPAHFLRDCVKIVDKAGNLVPLDISHPHYRRAQTYYVQNYLDQWWTTGRVRMVVLKCRQWGATTTTKGLDLHKMIFSEFAYCMTMADDRSGSEGVVGMLREMYNNLPEWIKPDTKREGTSLIQFDGFLSKGLEDYRNRSWIRVDTARNPHAGHKWTLRNWHGTEVARWGARAQEVLLGVRNAITKEGKSCIILESTAYGWGGAFFDAWQLAEKPHTQYRAIFIPWFAIDQYRIKPGSDKLGNIQGKVTCPLEMQQLIDEGRYEEAGLDDDEITLVNEFKDHHFGPIDAEQILWRRFAIDDDAGGDLDSFHQQYPSTPEEAFIVSGSHTFNSKLLLEQMQKCCDYDDRTDYQLGEILEVEQEDGTFKPEFKETAGGRIKIGAHPEEGHEYIVAVDVAEGDENPAGIEVVERKSGRAPDNTSIYVKDRHTGKQVLDATGRFTTYDAADMTLLIARYYNEAVMVPEMNAGYGTEILNTAKEENYPNIYERQIYDNSIMEYTTQQGWKTSSATRPQMMSTMKRAIRRKEVKFMFTDTVSELMTVVNKRLPSGRIREEAKGGRKDDRAFAAMIAEQVDRELHEVARLEDENLVSKVPPTHPHYWMWKDVHEHDNLDKVSQFSEPL